MWVHDRFDGGQAQSTAAWYGRESNLKDPVSDAFRDPVFHRWFPELALPLVAFRWAIDSE